MPLRIAVMSAVLVALAGCGTAGTGTNYTPPWLVGQAGPPYPYNSPYCP